MKYNSTHNITTTIQKITTTIQKKPNQQQLPQDHLRLATIMEKRIRMFSEQQS
jgi:hypothetical protein